MQNGYNVCMRMHVPEELSAVNSASGYKFCLAEDCVVKMKRFDKRVTDPY